VYVKANKKYNNNNIKNTQLKSAQHANTMTMKLVTANNQKLILLTICSSDTICK